MQSLPVAAQNVALAQATGLDQFAIQRGITADALKVCLADPKTPDALLKVRDAASTKYNLPGTPAFVLNGALVDGATEWKTLEPKLIAAGA